MVFNFDDGEVDKISGGILVLFIYTSICVECVFAIIVYFKGICVLWFLPNNIFISGSYYSKIMKMYEI